MNVIFVSNQPFPFGMAGSKRIRLFAEYLSIKNDVSVLVVGKNNGQNNSSGLKNKVKFNFFYFNRIQNIFGYLKIKKLITENYKTEKKNVLYLYDGIGLTNFLYAKYGKKIGFKVVTDIVEDYSMHTERTGFLLTLLHNVNRYFEKRTFQFTDGVIVLSTRLFLKLNALNPKNKPLVLIPVSAENLFFNYSDKKEEVAFNFLYSGSYGVKDGVDLLIEAFNKVSTSFNESKLILAGNITREIKEKIRLNPAIIYKGLIPDNNYYEFISSGNVLLMTRINSEYANSGFPFKLGEYLATGNPVIATKVSDVETYLKDKEDVILAEPSNVGSLISAMEFVINNRNNISSIGANGRKRCAQFFNPRINGEKLEVFLTQLFKNDTAIAK
ncbi:MAG: glycosyltransferase [Bacteroidetes bacterium]|nr:glycosyltransferase [Bacteroidota bacterium]